MSFELEVCSLWRQPGLAQRIPYVSQHKSEVVVSLIALLVTQKYPLQ